MGVYPVNGNKGGKPPYNPPKDKKQRKEQRLTEEEKTDSLRRKQKHTACGASRKESKKYKKEKTPRKEKRLPRCKGESFPPCEPLSFLSPQWPSVIPELLYQL